MGLEEMLAAQNQQEFMRKLMEQMQRRHRGQYVNQRPDLPLYPDSGPARPSGKYDAYLWHLLQERLQQPFKGPMPTHPIQPGGLPWQTPFKSV